MPQQTPPSANQPSSNKSWPTEPDRPMPDQGPVIDNLSRQDTSAFPDAEGEQVTLGLEGKADDPETARPLSHPHALMGEEPALGDTSRPG